MHNWANSYGLHLVDKSFKSTRVHVHIIILVIIYLVRRGDYVLLLIRRDMYELISDSRKEVAAAVTDRWYVLYGHSHAPSGL